MEKVKAKKYLGQHFLKDESIAERIAFSLIGNRSVLEIGPGMGVLTKYLLNNPSVNELKVIEIDTESVAYLKENYPVLVPNLIEGDFLRMDLDNIFAEQYAIMGNFPYNISNQILFKLFENREKVTQLVGMFQKEVAERIAAGPGSKTYGILSVLIQAWYKVEYLFTVHEHVFNPPPKVKSAVIRMTRNETTDLGCDEKLFKQIVKTTFNQRRKTLRNSIASILDKSHPLSADPIFNKRPEQLSVQEFVELTNRVEAALAEAKNRE